MVFLTEKERENLNLLRKWSSDFFSRYPLFDLSPKIKLDGDFDLVGLIVEIAVLSEEPSDHPSTSLVKERIRLSVQLQDYTTVRVTFAPDFPTGGVYKIFDFVRLRSVYVPTYYPIYQGKLLQELEINQLRKDLDQGHHLELMPSRYFNCLRIPAYFEIC